VTERRPLDRSSPAARLLGTVVLVLAIATAPVPRWSALGASLLAVAGFVAMTRPRPNELVRRLLGSLLAVLALVAPLLFVGRGQAALLLGGRASLALLAALSGASTLRAHEISEALLTLRVPHAITGVVDSMLHGLGAVREEGRRLLLARQLRGVRGLGIGPELLATLLERTAERAERVELAQRLRGFDPSAISKSARPSLRDLAVIGVSATAAVVAQLGARGA